MIGHNHLAVGASFLAPSHTPAPPAPASHENLVVRKTRCRHPGARIGQLHRAGSVIIGLHFFRISSGNRKKIKSRLCSSCSSSGCPAHQLAASCTKSTAARRTYSHTKNLKRRAIRAPTPGAATGRSHRHLRPWLEHDVGRLQHRVPQKSVRKNIFVFQLLQLLLCTSGFAPATGSA